MKTKAIEVECFNQTHSAISTAHPLYLLRHVAAVCRFYDYKYVTKTQAIAAGNQLNATYAAALANMDAADHFTDVECIDFDLADAVVAYWSDKDTKRPDYLQKACDLIGKSITIEKQLATLSLLIYEYLKRLNQALSELKFFTQWQDLVVPNTDVKFIKVPF